MIEIDCGRALFAQRDVLEQIDRFYILAYLREATLCYQFVKHIDSAARFLLSDREAIKGRTKAPVNSDRLQFRYTSAQIRTDALDDRLPALGALGQPW